MAGTDFLGRGWNFPIGLDEGGQIEPTPDGETSIRQSIWTILSTSPGERVMRPGFGCGLSDLVFGVNNAATATAVTRVVREALATWEPRIDVLDVYAAPDPSRPDVLVIEINYQVRATNSRSNLVYPFYLE
jgi:phage baseplate assembly protein W